MVAVRASPALHQSPSDVFKVMVVGCPATFNGTADSWPRNKESTTCSTKAGINLVGLYASDLYGFVQTDVSGAIGAEDFINPFLVFKKNKQAVALGATKLFRVMSGKLSKVVPAHIMDAAAFFATLIGLKWMVYNFDPVSDATTFDAK